MNRYRIRYRDPDPGCPEFTIIVRGHDRAHAIERFHDDDDDWIVLACERITDDTR